MSRKIHAFSARTVGRQRVTACSAYFAEGRGAVSASEDDSRVTCRACIKAQAKQDASLSGYGEEGAG